MVVIAHGRPKHVGDILKSIEHIVPIAGRRVTANVVRIAIFLKQPSSIVNERFGAADVRDDRR